jgi:hypothetical protein
MPGGTMDCPICGLDKPHSHSAEEQALLKRLRFAEMGDPCHWAEVHGFSTRSGTQYASYYLTQCGVRVDLISWNRIRQEIPSWWGFSRFCPNCGHLIVKKEKEWMQEGVGNRDFIPGTDKWHIMGRDGCFECGRRGFFRSEVPWLDVGQPPDGTRCEECEKIYARKHEENAC